MPRIIRNAFPYLAGAAGLIAVIWSISFGTLPPADLSFNNGTEIKTVDPPKATGAPEGRVIDALFEGLYRNRPKGMEFDDDGNIIKEPTPDADGNVSMEPVPAIAEKCEISPDGKTYTFTLRPGVNWTDGSPVTSHDFVWSWQRMLHPETASRYAYQLYYVVGAQQYNESKIEEGNRVEIELPDRPIADQTFPRGTMLRGQLTDIIKPPKPNLLEKLDQEERVKRESAWQEKWVYVVDVKQQRNGSVLWEAPGTTRAFSKRPAPAEVAYAGKLEKCRHLLLDFQSQVGLEAPDSSTLIVRLNNRTPFFLELVAFYPLYPVNRNCIETYGSQNWTKKENIVNNGPFRLEFRRLRDRVRLVKNPSYWDANKVKLNVVDAMAVESETTSFNLYVKDQLDWTTTVPSAIIPELKKRDDFISSPMMTVYFYRMNVTRPPLDDKRVRQALNMALNKQEICDYVVRAGQIPARSFVPPKTTDGYVSPQCGEYDVEKARQLLRSSGYGPGGKKLPKIQIVYNTNDAHRDIAQVIQQQWSKDLGVDVELRNLEWGTFLDTVHTLDYSVARAGWTGDYPDPNTFLDMFVKGSPSNETGWSNAKYDDLIESAKSETDPQRRLELFSQAEAILMDELPIIPIYFYVSINMVHPRVKYFYGNIQDVHPLHLLRVER